MTNLPSIGAFYQCFKRPAATLSVVDSFRKFYPDSDFFLVCDGGFDYSKLAQHYNLKYQYEPANVGNGTNNIFTTPDKTIAWAKRLRKAADLIKEDWIMLLEDDVLMMDKVKGPLSFTINGDNPDLRLGRKMVRFLKTRNKTIPFWRRDYYWGGFGGCIINRQFILDYFNNVEEDIKAIDKYSHWDKYSTDMWVSLLVLYHGGSIGPYFGLCETWYKNFTWRKDELKNIEILHQYKDLYDTPIKLEDLKILGESPEFVAAVRK